MFLDLLTTDNYVSYNIKLAHTLGLQEAIYVNQILNIMGKATKKDKLYEEGFVKIDRNYVQQRTTLDLENQLNIDKKLFDCGLLLRNFDNPDLIRLDTELLASLTSNDDVNLMYDIKAKMKKNAKSSSEAKQIMIVKSLSSAIKCTDSRLYDALVCWIKEIQFNKKHYLTKELVSECENKLFVYCKGDIDMALEVLNIAILKGYRDIQWAINIYEKENKKTQAIADNEKLSKKVF